MNWLWEHLGNFITLGGTLIAVIISHVKHGWGIDQVTKDFNNHLKESEICKGRVMGHITNDDCHFDERTDNLRYGQITTLITEMKVDIKNNAMDMKIQMAKTEERLGHRIDRLEDVIRNGGNRKVGP
jgi:hypothetical protein